MAKTNQSGVLPPGRAFRDVHVRTVCQDTALPSCRMGIALAHSSILGSTLCALARIVSHPTAFCSTHPYISMRRFVLISGVKSGGPPKGLAHGITTGRSDLGFYGGPGG